MVKTCSRCSEEKSLDDFSWQNKTKGKKQAWCKSCAVEHRMEKYYQNYEAEREQRDKWKKVTSDRNRALVLAHLQANPCVDCEEADILVLEFDHRDPETKEACVSERMNSWSAKKLQFEIDKCDIRCRNCHAKRTARQRGSWRLEHI